LTAKCVFYEILLAADNLPIDIFTAKRLIITSIIKRLWFLGVPQYFYLFILFYLKNKAHRRDNSLRYAFILFQIKYSPIGQLYHKNNSQEKKLLRGAAQRINITLHIKKCKNPKMKQFLLMRPKIYHQSGS
jgi:hypothetical protein